MRAMALLQGDPAEWRVVLDKRIWKDAEMKWVFLMLAFPLLLMGALIHAAADSSEVPPGHQNDLPLTFDIQAERLPGGDVKFVAKVMENKGSQAQFVQFPTEYVTTLGTYTIVDYTKRASGPHGILRSEHGETLRELDSKREGNVITCVFTVTKEELENPNLVFSFYVPAPHRMPGGSFFFARLRKFLKP